MAVNYSNQAAPRVTSKAVGHSQNKKVAWGSYELTDSGPMAANSILYMCKVPKGAYITGGRIYGDQVETATATSLMSVHVGINAGFTGIDGTVYTASTATACLVSSLQIGVAAGAVTGLKDTGRVNWPFGGLVVTNGPLLTADEALVYITFTASATTLSTGTLNVEVEYYTSTDS